MKSNITNFYITNAFESASISYFIKNISGISVISSNYTSYMSILIISIFLVVTHNCLSNLYSTFMFIFKQIISILYDIANTYVQHKKNISSLFMSYLFTIICVNNLVGLFPYSNTVNNHLNITLMLSFICWLGISFIGFKCFHTYLMSIFCVTGIPRVSIPSSASIEISSHVFRFVSLSLRLSANIAAGHISSETIYISIYNFTFDINKTKFTSILMALLPSFSPMTSTFFEIIISVLQGYISATLRLIYLRDGLISH